MNYLILALKRSGHHSLVNWVQAHTHQKTHNNCCFGWEDRKLLTMVGRKEATEGIANIEDFNMDDWNKYDFPLFPFLNEAMVLLVIRSANNWLASCYQRKFQSREEHKDVYKYLDSGYINDRKDSSPSRIDLYVKQLEQLKNKNFMVVEFDKWFVSKDYRKYLADKLHFEFNDVADFSRKYVASNGNGSSFDGKIFDLKADEMEVLSRDKAFVDDKEFFGLSKTFQEKCVKALKKQGIMK
ncbi:MAG TPA: hypothetical protein VMV77_09205 [Bacteroidales bacterium]|nr:hypothetical protein [Bacteroidales bacterium]